ncbi:A-kinase anchor protein 14 [Carlito syrichta]|uniref:A-kinase anchor protein 14 n=1 Tax=Carlito syrichta TaxID=1868482 RepID=A0A3Q0DJW6_CARSF|nr:A-kinase anchor protein 14 [Carlito syrichta]
MDNKPTSKKKVIIEHNKVNEVALALVQEVINAAIQIVEDAEHPIKNVKWITHGEFTEERGRRNIEEFVLTWEYQNRWVHYTEFIERKDLIHSFHYIYCVRWSVPTARRPIPRVTAATYFTIKINKNKPPDAPIDVSYIFEFHSLLHRPGATRFRERWTRDMIEAKNILLNQIPLDSIV